MPITTDKFAARQLALTAQLIDLRTGLCLGVEIDISPAGIAMAETDRMFMDRAIVQALKSAGEGGVPVGSVLAWRGAFVSEGHNQRQQRKVITLHGETDCLMKAGLFGRWRETTLYTTLSPCMMCSGTIIQFGIPRVVIADIENFGGNEEFLRSRGVKVDILRDEQMIAFFRDWKAHNMDIWNGDIGLS